MASESRQKTQDAVNALRDSIENCDLAMLIDSDTGLVLCIDSETTLPHDVLERIADTAKVDAGSPLAKAMADDGAPLSVSKIDADGWTVALKASAGDEFLVCRCATAPDRTALDAAAQVVFDVLSPADEV